jgi:hypothetical protein
MSELYLAPVTFLAGRGTVRDKAGPPAAPGMPRGVGWFTPGETRKPRRTRIETKMPALGGPFQETTPCRCHRWSRRPQS